MLPSFDKRGDVVFRFVFPALMLAAIVVAGCGGGGGGSFIAAPTATPSQAPAQQATTVPLSTTTTTPVDLGSVSNGGVKVIDSVVLTLPAASVASTATITLTATAPTGVLAPSARSVHLKQPATLGVPSTPLAYIGVTVNTTTTWSQIPAFQFAFPSAVGGNCYIVFYDSSNPTQGWQGVAGPQTCGTDVSISSAKVAKQLAKMRGAAITLNAGTAYTYALVTTASTISTPTPTPTNAPTPAYCTQFANAGVAGGANLFITDDSGLNAPLIIYLTDAVDMPNHWIDANGNSSTVPVPLPAACFSTTLNSSGTAPLQIPGTVPGGHIYLVYATPNPNPSSTTVPNPFGTSMPLSGPNEGFSFSPYPWDFVEYGTTAASALIIDTTQVNAMGLPLELSVTATSSPLPVASPNCGTSGSASIVGVTSCNYAAIFTKIATDPQYSDLVITQPFNGNTIYDMRLLSPYSAPFSSFPWNIMGDPAYLPQPLPTACSGPTTYGYLSCVLSSYQTTPRLYSSALTVAKGALGSGDLYCVSSDGVSNFIMTDVGPGPATPGPAGTIPPSSPNLCNAGYTPYPTPTDAPVNPFKMPVQEFLYGLPPAADGGGGCKIDILFQQPWGLYNVDEGKQNGSPTTGHVFKTNDAFALWKVLLSELVYGTTLSTGEHPIGYWATPAPASAAPPFAPMFTDPMSDNYDSILHTYFDNHLTYGLAYDDFFEWAPTLLYHHSGTISIRVNPIPTAAAATNPNPPATPVPSPCNALPSEVGSF